MRTTKREYHLDIQVPEDVYKVDLQLADRYLAYSAEALRLSGLGLAGFGFLLSEVFLKQPAGHAQTAFVSSMVQARNPLALGAVSFGLSIATALAHRYYTTECLTHFIRGLRLWNEEAPERLSTRRRSDSDGLSVDELRTREEASLRIDLVWSKWTLRLCASFLALGAACVAWAFAVAVIGMR